MAKISRRAALVSVIAVGVGASVGVGYAVSRQQPATTAGTTPSPDPPSSPSPPASVTPTPTPSPTPSVDTRPRWPLSGRLVGDLGVTHRPAVAVKVPDNREEHPQRGIDAADIVFVELEGYRDPSGYSSTRLVPVFHSRMPDTVEPVRSIRPVDIALLSPMDAIIGNTGGSPWVLNYVQHNRAHVEGMLSYMETRGTGSYGTDWSRVYSQGGETFYDRATTCHPAVLAKQTTRFRNGPPQAYFPWASNDAEVSARQGRPARSIGVPYKGDDYVMSYDYDAGSKRYRRSMPWGPHVLADGTRITVDNVLVIKAHQRYGKIFSGRGGDEPLHEVIDASGPFVYANRGRCVEGTWHKGAVAEPFTFTLPDGTDFKMAPGQTFVELPDTKATLTIKG